MDLTTVDAVRVARTRADVVIGPDAAVLAGGTWLYSEPQPGLRELVDVTGLGWPPVEIDDTGVTLAATCTIAELVALAPVPGWTSQHLVRSCAEALVASEKIWGAATVGGNLCTALPAGAITSLAVALDGTAVVWTPDGGERRLAVADLVTGVRTTALTPGEVLRAVHLPASTLRARAVFRRAALTPHGRSGTVVIGRLDDDGALVVTVTAGVRRPHRLRFDALPDAHDLAVALDAVDDWYDDVHGAPDWRRAMTLRLAEEARAELSPA
ncbi:FAD binding domain-containing protein [Cellulomonas sp. ATA003]|uniref:FAD binding domain-containing protein n=1 Tax=Cellulomonas sp. ATA003 TaxID=3073064 RepID=UPI002873F1E4|nr:FAD binding domain-containing protein [Cellulomonas sp. ATA003]WNB86535.1 FAD binding domain-containing protein [Cellulomonas sp. ATA003]